MKCSAVVVQQFNVFMKFLTFVYMKYKVKIELDTDAIRHVNAT